MRDDEPAWLEGHIPPRRIPDRSDGLPGCAVLLILAGLAGLVSLLSGVAAGQEDPGLLLARTCVSERGWALDTNDCAAILDVATARMERRGGSLSENLRALSPTLHGSGPLSRAWLRDLDRDGHQPREWPRARWSRREGSSVARREDWLATLAEADRLVSTPGRVCIPMASAWGSTSDLAHHVRAHPGHRWRGSDCGATVNHFGTWETRR